MLPDKIAVCCGQILYNRFCNAEMESTSDDLCDVLRILLPLLLRSDADNTSEKHFLQILPSYKEWEDLNISSNYRVTTGSRT